MGTSIRSRAAAFALLLFPLPLAACGASVSSAESPSLDKPVPITLQRDDGSQVAIPVSGVRAVVLDFWSTSCEPCKRTVPAVLAKRAEIEKKGALLLLVGVLDKDQTPDDAKSILALWGVQEPFLVDQEGAYLKKIGARDVPAFAVVDSGGILRWVAPDSVTMANVLAAIP